MNTKTNITDGEDNYITFELRRAWRRREAMHIARPDGHKDAQWGLSLSGGGIRSATFCLGALQGLSCAHPPTTAANPAGPDSPLKARDSLLGQFDYLSTVSGGGYIGSFFGSLFVKNRLDLTGNLSDEDTAAQAYDVFRSEPPGRLRGDVFFDRTAPGKAPLAWLRENGRYMAPTGSGDMIYALAVAIRNWFGMQYVLGTILLTVFALLALVRSSLVYGSFVIDSRWLELYRNHEWGLLCSVMEGASTVWWSSVWWLPLALFFTWLVPFGTAFWLTHPSRGGTVADRPRFTLASSLTLGVGALFAYLAFRLVPDGDASWAHVRWTLIVCSAISLQAVFWYALTAVFAESISSQRVTLTRALARGLIWVAVISIIALVETAAQTGYIMLGSGAWVAPTAVTGALVWIARQLTPILIPSNEKGTKVKLPVNMLMSVAGIALLCLVALFWSMVVLWLQWRASYPRLDAAFNLQASWEMLAVVGDSCGIATPRADHRRLPWLLEPVNVTRALQRAADAGLSRWDQRRTSR